MDKFDGIEDPQEIIDEEREKTYLLLIRQKTSYKKGYFKETLIKASRAKRAYTGYMLKAVYMTNDSDQFFNVENLALHYYGKQGWNGVHSENRLM